MGEFLSQPDKTKHSDDGQNEHLRYGSCGMQGWRKRMEDAHITDISKGPDGRYQIFGVFDGHGGKEVSQFTKKYFTNSFLECPELSNGNVKLALKKTFLKMDELMRTPEGKEDLINFNKLSKIEDDEQDRNNPNPNAQMNMISMLMNQAKTKEDIAMNTGCTACVCVIDTEDKRMYFANAGDSRVVLCKNGIAKPMSTDHKPELDEERNRIYKADGWITEGRVKGNINLSRGFGDLDYKQKATLPPEEQMVTANPDINMEVLEDDDDFIILGCDGIWDCLKNQEACDLVKKGIEEDPKGKLSSIIEKMMDKICAVDIYSESGLGADNMTCIIVDLKKRY
ncbi:MAG: protein phosphatase 2C domain-containing protein [archaeon]|nr:protein phosphatase 2C domain-containing protein [archaeon]